MKNNIIKIIAILIIILFIFMFIYSGRDIGLEDLYKNIISSNNEYKDYTIDEYDKYVTIETYNGNDEKVEIPSYINGKPVKTIEDSAFYGNLTVKEIIIPKTIIRVGHQAFIGCVNLRKIYIPSSILDFGRYALDNCPNLEKIFVDKNSVVENLLIEYGYKKIINYK